MAGIQAFLEQLENDGELVRVRREVQSRFEASGIIKKVQKTINKAVVFEHVEGYKYPIVSNIFGTYNRVCRLMGCKIPELNQTWNLREENMELYAPVSSPNNSERIECTINDITSLIYTEKDGGAYITAGMVFVRDPEENTPNMSFHRIQIVDNNKLRIRMTPGNHLGLLFDKAERMNKPLEIAILIGGHPALMLAAASRIGIDSSELNLAGSLLGEPIRMQYCNTINMEIPADVDFVIEGNILPGARETEGPFGDFLGYYIPESKNHVVEVKYVSRLRDNCHAYGILAGSVEQNILMAVPVAGNIYKALRTAVPSVTDVACLPLLYHSVVKIKQQFPGQARQAGLAALSFDPSQTKYCTVVDEDVDIHELSDVHWAIVTRCSPEKDIIILPNVPSFRRDPMNLFSSKMVIDATKPITTEELLELTRTVIPGLDEIDLSYYLS